jgi:poly(glycerol-phosphate) alpha-glucosyltransferase
MTLQEPKILGITPSLSRAGGGVSRVVCELSSELHRQGLPLEALSLWDEYVEEDCRMLSFPFRSFSTKGLRRRFGYSPELRDALMLSDAQIFHVHVLWMYPGVAAGMVARKRGIPVMISPHNLLSPLALQISSARKRIAGILFVKRNLRSAACIHALCEAEYRDIRRYGLSAPVAVIPNGIMIPEVEPLSATPWRDVVPSGQKVMLYLGRIYPSKGLANLVEAWAQMKRSIRTGSDWVLVIAGWSQEGHEDTLKEMVRKSGLQNDVFFLGPVFEERKRATLANADSFVLPSTFEGLPMAVLEAWSYGLPVIMTTECNLPEGFQERAAVEVHPDTDAIAQGLAAFFSMSDEERLTMGANGRRLVETRFTWPRIAGQMIEVYKWILGQGERPDCVKMD